MLAGKGPSRESWGAVWPRHYAAPIALLSDRSAKADAFDPAILGQAEGSHSSICVSRAGHWRRYEIYRIPYRERLPAFRVPLRPSDPDVPLDLQPLVDRCYRTGRYWQVNDPQRVAAGFTEDERHWIGETVGED